MVTPATTEIRWKGLWEAESSSLSAISVFGLEYVDILPRLSFLIRSGRNQRAKPDTSNTHSMSFCSRQCLSASFQQVSVKYGRSLDITACGYSYPHDLGWSADNRRGNAQTLSRCYANKSTPPEMKQVTVTSIGVLSSEQGTILESSNRQTRHSRKDSPQEEISMQSSEHGFRTERGSKSSVAGKKCNRTRSPFMWLTS